MYLKVKRCLDILCAMLAIILFSIFFIVISIVIKCSSKGPVLFSQKRVGKNKKYFKLYKFRTMKTETPSEMPTHLLQNPDAYITAVGRFLRKSSLDELPQLWNILIGNMSIVGPRPALWNQYDLIEERDKYGANDILPGLTGLAQIRGRDELPIPVKAEFDGEYVAKMGFLFDVKIICLTAVNVFRAEGVVEGERRK